MASQDRAVFQVRAVSKGKDTKILDLTGRVLSFEYLDHTSKADKLELVVDNHDLANFDDPTWRKGMILSVAWGYHGNMSETRRCIVKKVKGSLKLKIEAHEQTMALHQVQKCRVWQNLTLKEMADKIQFEYAAILDYEAKVEKDKNLQTLGDNLQIIHAVQAAETDAAFLARMAKKFGLTFALSSRGKVQFHQPDLKVPPVKTITWRGGVGDWHDFNIENDITGLVGTVTMKGIDTSSKKKVEATADNDSTKRDGLMPVQEAIGLIAKDTGAYTQGLKPQEDTSKNNSASVEHTGANEAGKEQIQAKAEAKFKASQRNTVKLTGTIIGDPKVRAKQIMEVQGLGKRVSGKYRVIQARHHIDEHGKYRVDFVAKSDGHGGYGAGDNPPSKADPNREKPLDAAGTGSATETVLVIEKTTGKTHQEFYPKGGDSK